MTVFLGCGFAAKYREGGGNFSVPLQWMLGLRRLQQDAIWLEWLPATESSAADAACIANFQRQLPAHRLAGRYCLLYQEKKGDGHDLAGVRCLGISKRELRERLTGPNVLLNISYSIHPPFLLEFERRIFCDLDPGEIFYWMTKMELGQSSHHEFWTIGLNVNQADCRLPRSPLPWRTFFRSSTRNCCGRDRGPDERSSSPSGNGIGGRRGGGWRVSRPFEAAGFHSLSRPPGARPGSGLGTGHEI